MNMNSKKKNNGKQKKNGNDNSATIRTLYVAPFAPNMYRSIVEYFEQFGEIEAVVTHFGNNFHCGFVKFKVEECAKAALLITSHRIENRSVMVKAALNQPNANQWPQDPLLTPPEQDSPQQILNRLNEDCLRAIFKSLKLKDLCNAAEVCKNFKQRAEEVFRSKYQNSTIREFLNLNEYEVESLLDNFGPLITSVYFYEMKNISGQNSFLPKIEAKCRNLKELILYNFSDFGLECYPLFSKLERLSLHDCHFGIEARDLLSVCKKLQEFDISGTVSDALINQNFPMLEKAIFDYSICKNYPNSDGLRGFLTSNPTLTYLSIYFYGPFHSELFAGIGQSLPNLMYLRIVCIFKVESSFQQDIVFLGQLKSLRTLDIMHVRSFSITPLITSFVTNQTPIQTLSLCYGVIDDNAVEVLSQLKQIKELTLGEIGHLTDENLVSLAKELPELKKLYLNKKPDDFGSIALKKVVANAKKLSFLRFESLQGIEIDVDDYKAMLKSVKSRPEKVKLKIEIYPRDKVHVPEEMMNENREWLYIE